MDFIITFLSQYGYWGMFLAAFLAGSFFPFSSEAVMIALMATGLDPWQLMIYGTIGNVSGDYIYFVTEPTKVDNYKDATYSNPPATPSGEWTTSDTGALNGGKIVNTPVDAFELPHTGGIGTHPYRTAGIIMVITALLGVFYMKRRENRHSA